MRHHIQLLCYWLLFLSFAFITIVSSNDVTNSTLSCGQLLNQRNASNVWLQVAHPRTSSTLQYTILVLVGAMLCDGHGVLYDRLEAIAPKTSKLTNVRPEDLRVMKTHTFDNIHSMPRDGWLFISQRFPKKETNEFNRTYEWYYPRVKVFQTIHDVRHGSEYVLKTEYKDLFQLTEQQVDILVEIFSKWEILRKCCGAQMSATWRQTLTGEANRTQATEGEPHECEQYGDFKQIEQSYINSSTTYGLPLMGYKRVGQCECDIELTRKYSLKFNDARYKQCR